MKNSAPRITHVAAFQSDAIRVDPIRLIEAVTAGVAFLAAGIIILSKGEVQGLTTGAQAVFDHCLPNLAFGFSI